MDHCTGVGQRSDVNGTTVLMVQSLHREEFHRHDDINVTSPGKEISLLPFVYADIQTNDEKNKTHMNNNRFILKWND